MAARNNQVVRSRCSRAPVRLICRTRHIDELIARLHSHRIVTKSDDTRECTVQICPQHRRWVLRKARLDNARRGINAAGRKAISPAPRDDVARHVHTAAQPAKARQDAVECRYPPRAIAKGRMATIPRRGEAHSARKDVPACLGLIHQMNQKYSRLARSTIDRIPLHDSHIHLHNALRTVGANANDIALQHIWEYREVYR